jgi:hypothetical protein
VKSFAGKWETFLKKSLRFYKKRLSKAFAFRHTHCPDTFYGRVFNAFAEFFDT